MLAEKWAAFFRRILLRPMFWWLRSQATSSDLKASIALDPDAATIYVVPKRSFIDSLVVYYHCKRKGLPLPLTPLKDAVLMRGTRAAVFSLSTPGPFRAKPSLKSTRAIEKLLGFLHAQPSRNIQVVPVSIIWGKNPGRRDSSIFRLLFHDDENSGWIRKFFILLAHGRSNIAHFGKPIHLREQLQAMHVAKDGSDVKADQVSETFQKQARKLHRVMRVHFRSQRSGILGQPLYIRSLVIERILASQAIKSAIAQEVKRGQSNEKKVEAQARKYLNEIAGDQSFWMVRVFEVMLRYVWNKIFAGIKVSGLERVKKLQAENHQVIFVANHRSHLDYLLMNYALFTNGLPCAHTASGVNLNFWPIGGALRKTGAFFLKRRFAGNRLYKEIFTQYLGFLISGGYSFTFFPEGGRSRSGKLLKLRTGMISMILDSVGSKGGREVYFVPVNVSYDRVVEVATYIKEISGKRKKPESVKGLLKTRSILKQSFGKAYLNYGEPIKINRSDLSEAKADERTAKFTASMVESVAEGISAASALTPSALISLALLSVPQRALGEDELKAYLQMLVTFSENCEPLVNCQLISTDPSELIIEAETLGMISRFRHPGGDVIYLTHHQARTNSYYRNNIIHSFALSSLIASFLFRLSAIGRQDLMNRLEVLYPILKQDLQLPWPSSSLDWVVTETLKSMEQVGIIRQKKASVNDEICEGAAPDSISYEYLGFWGTMVDDQFERIACLYGLLAKAESSRISLGGFKDSCQKITKKIAILSGASNPENLTADYFRSHLLLLQQNGFITMSEDEDELHIKPEVERLFQAIKPLIRRKHHRHIESVHRAYIEQKRGKWKYRQGRGKHEDLERVGKVSRKKRVGKRAVDNREPFAIGRDAIDLPKGAFFARVVEVHKRFAFVSPEDAEGNISTRDVWLATVARRYLDTEKVERNLIAVGEQVICQSATAEEIRVETELPCCVIQRRLERKSALVRCDPHRPELNHVLAANVDLLVIVASFLKPEIRWGLIDRYLVMAEEQQLPAAIVLTKKDLLENEGHADFQDKCREMIDLYKGLGYQVLCINTLGEPGKQGAKELKPLIDGKTVLFSGHSGVGKSSLVNLFKPEINQAVEENADIFYKGRHTTTYASFIKLLALNTYVIDTPGVRSLLVGERDPIQLSFAFREMKQRRSECAFRECRHIDEPDCAVRAALESGDIHPSRYQSYRTLLQGGSGREGRLGLL